MRLLYRLLILAVLSISTLTAKPAATAMTSKLRIASAPACPPMERFKNAKLLPSGKSVTLEMDKAGYIITLPHNEPWNPVDTAIQMERK